MARLATTVVDRLTRTFEAARDDARAVAMATYMRDQFPFLGIPTPARRRLTREVMREFETPGERELAFIARRCWKLDAREYQYAACDIVGPGVRHCSASFLAELRWLVTNKSWWDTVDPLSHAVGELVCAHPELGVQMDTWFGDPDHWIARVALLHQLGYKQQTDTDRLFGYCARRAGDSEFFIRKAIGWALREYSKTDAAAVVEFVDAHRDLSPLSRREALRRVT